MQMSPEVDLDNPLLNFANGDLQQASWHGRLPRVSY